MDILKNCIKMVVGHVGELKEEVEHTKEKMDEIKVKTEVIKTKLESVDVVRK